MTQSSPLDVSFLIVSWNVSELLEKCLASIQRHTKVSYEVVVVDNNSSDDSVAMIRDRFPEVKLIASTDNLGFTKGNNVAMNEASGRYICYLNPDVELIEDAITPLVEYLDKHPKVGIIGPKMLNSDRSHQSSIGRFTTLGSLINEYVFRSKAETHRLAHPDQPTAVEFLMGAFLLVRGTILRQVGGFDERYFMYHEETDLCLTFKKLGYATVYYPLVRAVHYGSQSANKTPEIRQRTMHQNRKSQYLFFRKQYGFIVALLAKLIIFWGVGSRAVFLSLKQAIRPASIDRIKIRYYLLTCLWLLGNW